MFHGSERECRNYLDGSAAIRHKVTQWLRPWLFCCWLDAQPRYKLHFDNNDLCLYKRCSSVSLLYTEPRVAHGRFSSPWTAVGGAAAEPSSLSLLLNIIWERHYILHVERRHKAFFSLVRHLIFIITKGLPEKQQDCSSMERFGAWWSGEWKFVAHSLTDSKRISLAHRVIPTNPVGPQSHSGWTA